MHQRGYLVPVASLVFSFVLADDCPAAWQTSFPDIVHFGNGASFNLPWCAQYYIRNVQPAVGCDNANCVVEQANQAVAYVANGVQKDCDNNCNAYSYATQLLLDFVTSVAEACSSTVPPITAPTGNPCSTTLTSVVTPTSGTPSGTTLSMSTNGPSSATAKPAASSAAPPAPISGWTKAATIGTTMGVFIALCVATGGFITWLRRRAKKRTERAMRDDEQQRKIRNAENAPTFELDTVSSVEPSDAGSDADTHTRH